MIQDLEVFAAWFLVGAVVVVMAIEVMLYA